MYVNALANSVMLHASLKRDFYNIIFKIKYYIRNIRDMRNYMKKLKLRIGLAASRIVISGNHKLRRPKHWKIEVVAPKEDEYIPYILESNPHPNLIRTQI